MQPFKQPIPVGRKKSLSNHGYSSIKAYIVFLQEMDKRTEDSRADKDSFSSKRAPDDNYGFQELMIDVLRKVITASRHVKIEY